MIEYEVYRRLYGDKYDLAAIVDNFKSIIIDDNYQDANKLELVVSYSKENALLYVPETVIKVQGVFYYVVDERVSDISTNELTVTAKSLVGKAGDRIIDGNYIVYKEPEQIAGELFSNHVANNASADRRFNYLTLDSVQPFSTSKINYQNSYGTVLKEINTLMVAYDFGFKEVATPGNLGNSISIVKGRDLSKVVEISTDFENLLKAGYENSITDYKNYAITLGEGDGADRVRVNYDITIQDLNGYMGKDNAAGIDRKEVYIDARDLQHTDSTTNVTLSDSDYKQALRVRANTKLMEQQQALSLTGQLNTNNKLYTLGQDFGLGDTVKISSSLFGLKKSAMITSIKYTYDSTGEYIEPTFGKQSPTVFDILARK